MNKTVQDLIDDYRDKMACQDYHQITVLPILGKDSKFHDVSNLSQYYENNEHWIDFDFITIYDKTHKHMHMLGSIIGYVSSK